jgi:hypothetical protein
MARPDSYMEVAMQIEEAASDVPQIEVTSIAASMAFPR